YECEGPRKRVNPQKHARRDEKERQNYFWIFRQQDVSLDEMVLHAFLGAPKKGLRSWRMSKDDEGVNG
ncbi:MAG: hypothetical protein J0H87_06505, partial [Holosporales bacterium]|nr:hypothetical protein [Holosporales bacterium]